MSSSCAGSMMAKKLLTKRQIDSLGASLLEVDLQSLSKSSMEALSQSPQTSMKQFPSRSTFMKRMQSDGMQENLQHFIFGLCQLYKSYLIKYKAKTKIDKFAAFQVGWLQSVRGIVERGELATCCEESDDPEDMAEEESKLAEEVSYFVLGCFDAVPSKDDLLAIFHTIARHVFHHIQSRALTIKASQLGDAEALTDVTAIYEDSDDVLLRICGAQLNRMIVLRKETLKTKQESKNVDLIRKELNFLQGLTMNAEQKEESLSTALKSTERGGHTFPVVHVTIYLGNSQPSKR